MRSDVFLNDTENLKSGKLRAHVLDFIHTNALVLEVKVSMNTITHAHTLLTNLSKLRLSYDTDDTLAPYLKKNYSKSFLEILFPVQCSNFGAFLSDKATNL